MIKKIMTMASMFTMAFTISSTAVSAYSINIENVDKIGQDIGGFTLWADVGADFVSNSQTYGNAVPANWVADNAHNSHFGASDLMGLLTGKTTPLQNGTLVSFNYTGTGPLTIDNPMDSADTPFSLVKFTAYDGVDLFATGKVVLKSFDAAGATFGAPVPVPGAIWLLGAGLSGLVATRRKKQS